MADKTPKTGSSPLEPADRVLYKEIATGIYALVNGASLMVGSGLVSESNPLPTTAVTCSTNEIIPTHTAVNVTNASGQIVGANNNRKYLLIENDSDEVIYINLGNAAVVNRGIRLNSNGGAYEISAGLGNLYVGTINAVHGGIGIANVMITEGI